MKRILRFCQSLAISAAFCQALATVPAAAAGPCGFDWAAATNGAAYVMPCDFAPVSVTPHGAAGTTTVERVHGTWTNTFSIGTNRTGWSELCGGTNWFFLKGDLIRVTGSSNTVLEVQGTR